MRFGISLPNNQGVQSVRDLADLAAHAERLGYDSVWVSDHLFHTGYVAKRLGDRPYHEPLTVLTAAAMLTQKVQLGTSVLVLPWHHPVRLAKVVASLDELSGGRVILGVGVGVAQDEYANLNIEFNQRGAIADEMLDAMQELWTQATPEFRGKYFHFSGLRFEPKPTQKPYPPILVGGNSAAAMRRLLRYGDGWHPLGLSAEELSGAIVQVRTAYKQVNQNTFPMPVCLRLVVEFMEAPWERPPDQRRTLKGTPEEMIGILQAYQQIGATEVVLDVNSGDIDLTARTLERLESEVLPAFR